MTLQTLLAKLVLLEMDLSDRQVHDGQRLIRDARMRLQYAARVRIRSTETSPEFARRKAAAIERRMAEASRVAEMWEGV